MLAYTNLFFFVFLFGDSQTARKCEALPRGLDLLSKYDSQTARKCGALPRGLDYGITF